MIRRRVLLVACLFGGLALAGYGLYRWPLEYRSSRFVDDLGRTRDRSRFDFVGDSTRTDRLIGTADYLAAALLFAAGPWFRFGRIPRLGSEDQRPDGELLDLIVVGSCVLGGLAMTLVTGGAVVSLFRS
ncbi:MAG TPA: hypothetical protein VNM14_01050 [Planctomycetota bacterium]|jgi:hypothetical protein|nr:hypothetical protein [Planctomycetota bacterium]